MDPPGTRQLAERRAKNFVHCENSQEAVTGFGDPIGGEVRVRVVMGDEPRRVRNHTEDCVSKATPKATAPAATEGYMTKTESYCPKQLNSLLAGLEAFSESSWSSATCNPSAGIGRGYRV